MRSVCWVSVLACSVSAWTPARSVRALAAGNETREEYDLTGACVRVRDFATREQRCSVAKSKECGNGYFVAYYCAESATARVVLALGYVLWLALLFTLLGSTADEYFSPALEQLSADAGLPPRFAGVTLLALGNGAPDVSSTIHAVSSSREGYRLALGALTGAGMFVGTVVAGAVMVVADGAKAKGALLRDVCAYLLTCATVFVLIGAGGVVTYHSVALLLSLYAAFVLVVLAADLWHRRPDGPHERQRASESTSGASEEPPAIELLLTLLHDVRRHTNCAIRPDSSSDSEDSASSPVRSRTSLISPRAAAAAAAAQPPRNSFFEDFVGADDSGETGGQGYVVIDGDCAPLELGASPFDGDAYTANLLLSEGGTAAPAPLKELVVLELVGRAKAHVMGVLELPPLRRLAAIAEMPFVALRRCSVPLTSADDYARAPLVLSMLGAPLWLCVYASNRGAKNVFAARLFPPSSFFLATIVSVVGAACVAAATADDRPLPKPAVIGLALFGFAVAATWIDVFADQLVQTLEFFGALANIPEPALGLTVLAWGNSIGDLSTNVAMAKKGLANMAITACFAGPVFNMLVGLGVGFSARLAATGEDALHVSLDPGLVAGFSCLIFNCAALLCVGVWRGGRVPRQFGYFTAALYAAYLVLSLAILLRK